MIVTRLYGGLGNQMFQYAAGRRLALAHGVPLYLDLRWFASQSKRRFELEFFDVDAIILTDVDWEALRGRLPEVTQQHFRFDARLLGAPGHCLLDGYWQSPRYFGDIGPIVRCDFQSSRPPTEFERATAILFQQVREPVSVHVRRGDYVSEPRTATFHGICSTEYYSRAMSLVRRLVPDAHFFLFSDDPDWTGEQLASADATVVRSPDASHPGETIRLMALARHHVIANSSFSWWGAWLAPKDDQSLTIAPRPWFAGSPESTDDLLPGPWMTLGC